MRAVAVFPAERVVRLVEHPEPKLERPTDVLLEILDVGMCGTDREIARFEYGAPPPGSPYLVVRNESLGRVLDAGPAVTRLRRGDLAVTMVRRPCARADCPACTAGRQAIALDAAAFVRDMVLENQLVFGTVNAGPDAFEAAVEDLARFHERWPGALRALVTDRHPPENAPLLLARPPTGIKSVVTFARPE